MIHAKGSAEIRSGVGGDTWTHKGWPAEMRRSVDRQTSRETAEKSRHQKEGRKSRLSGVSHPLCPASPIPLYPASPIPLYPASPTPLRPAPPIPSVRRLPSPSVRRLPSPPSGASHPLCPASPIPSVRRLPSPSIRRPLSPSIRRLPPPSVRRLPSPSVRRLPSPSVRRLPSPSVRRLPSPLSGVSHPPLSGASHPRYPAAPHLHRSWVGGSRHTLVDLLAGAELPDSGAADGSARRHPCRRWPLLAAQLTLHGGVKTLQTGFIGRLCRRRPPLLRARGPEHWQTRKAIRQTDGRGRQTYCTGEGGTVQFER